MCKKRMVVGLGGYLVVSGFVSLPFDGEVGPTAQLSLVHNRCSVKGHSMTG